MRKVKKKRKIKRPKKEHGLWVRLLKWIWKHLTYNSIGSPERAKSEKWMRGKNWDLSDREPNSDSETSPKKLIFVIIFGVFAIVFVTILISLF